MSKPVDYCTVEFDFLTGGTNRTFMSLTSAQRFAYMCAWSYAVHLRRLHLSCYEMKDRLGAIYDIDRRTVAKMLQRCCEDADLLIKENGGYTVVGVNVKHSKLGGWKAVEPKDDGILTGDSKVKDSKVQDRIVKNKYSEDGDEVRLAQLLYDLCKRDDSKFKEPNIQKWAEHIDRLIRIDGRNPKEVEDVMRWAKNDDFWNSNILSPSKLRKQFSQLKIKMESKKSPGRQRLTNDRDVSQYEHLVKGPK